MVTWKLFLMSKITRGYQVMLFSQTPKACLARLPRDKALFTRSTPSLVRIMKYIGLFDHFLPFCCLFIFLVTGLKLLIGRRLSHASGQSQQKIWPFKVIAGPHNRPMMIAVNYKGEEKQLHP